MGYEVIVTEHAFDRLRERCGINKRACIRLAEKAYEQGIKHSETSGRLYKFVSSIAENSHKGADIRIYGDKAYVFSKRDSYGGVQKNKDNSIKIFLVTVLNVPYNLSKQTRETMSKKKRA